MSAILMIKNEPKQSAGKAIDENNRPEPHPFYGDSWERGLDPWHRDAFPDEFKGAAPNQGPKRGGGWYLLDAWKNQIGFVPDTR